MTKLERRRQNLIDGSLRPRGLMAVGEVECKRLSTARARAARLKRRRTQRASRKANRPC